MSNALTTAQLPQHLQALLQNNALQTLNQDATKGIGVGGWPRISIKGNRFRLQDPQGQELVVPQHWLDVVVLGVNPHGVSKIFYAGAYDPSGDGTAPTCYSDNGVGPSVRAAAPQCGTCAACPNNVWGSKITPSGAQVKACTDTLKLAVLLADNTSGEIFELRIPAASLSNWGAYIRGLDAAGKPAALLITRIQFDTASDYPKLTFDTPIINRDHPLPWESYPYISPEMAADIQDAYTNNKREIAQCTGSDDKAIDAMRVGAAATSVIVQQPPGQPVYGPPRAPLAPATLPPMPANYGAPVAAGPLPHPGPARPAVTAQQWGDTITVTDSATPEKPKRTRRTKAQLAEASPQLPLQPDQQNPGYPQTVPEYPARVHLSTGAIHGGMPIPPGGQPPSARDLAAPLSAQQTDASMDDLIRRAMGT